jgi:hypothetical protein
MSAQFPLRVGTQNSVLIMHTGHLEDESVSTSLGRTLRGANKTYSTATAVVAWCCRETARECHEHMIIPNVCNASLFSLSRKALIWCMSSRR